jgi:DNA-binding transcriptional ArsR family regulator
LTRLFNLSGNAARLKILYLLKREGEMCPCDLSDVLEISVGGVSQHLRKLKDGGLVVDKKVGQTVFYSLVAQSTELLLPVFDILSTSKRTVES